MIDMPKLLIGLIQADTINPPGHTVAAVEIVEAVFDTYGISTQRYFSDPMKPALVVRIPGAGTASPLLIHGHLDVVPVRDQTWLRDPLGGEVVDGDIWGRGALDMKGPIVMMIEALLRVHATEAPPAGDILLCIVPDEEVGGTAGARFLVEQHPELFDGIQYAIGEFGGFPFVLDGTRFYPIQISERRGVEFDITFVGTPGHGSMPVRRQSMAKLGSALTRLDRGRLPVHLTPPARLMIGAFVEHSSGSTRIALRGLLDERTAGPVLRMLGSQLGVLEPMLRNTVSPTVVSGGDKVNVIPAETRLRLDGRLLPGLTPESMRDELVDLLGPDAEIGFEAERSGIPAVPDMGLFDTMADAIRVMDPEGVPIPYMTPAVTDARWFSQLGIHCYGFTPMTLPDEFAFQTTVHGENERIPISGLEAGADALTVFLSRYGR